MNDDVFQRIQDGVIEQLVMYAGKKVRGVKILGWVSFLVIVSGVSCFAFGIGFLQGAKFLSGPNFGFICLAVAGIVLGIGGLLLSVLGTYIGIYSIELSMQVASIPKEARKAYKESLSKKADK